MCLQPLNLKLALFKKCTLRPFGHLQVDFEPLRTPTDPYRPFQTPSGPPQTPSDGLHTPTTGFQLKKKRGKPVGTIVEQYNSFLCYWLISDYHYNECPNIPWDQYYWAVHLLYIYMTFSDTLSSQNNIEFHLLCVSIYFPLRMSVTIGSIMKGPPNMSTNINLKHMSSNSYYLKIWRHITHHITLW